MFAVLSDVCVTALLVSWTASCVKYTTKVPSVYKIYAAVPSYGVVGHNPQPGQNGEKQKQHFVSI